MSVRLPLQSQKSNAILKKFFKTNVSQAGASSDLEFLKNLSEQQNLTFDFGVSTGVENMITITPATGTTFYFITATVQSNTGTNRDYALFNDGILRQRVTLDGGQIYEFSLPFDRLVGDGTKSYTLEAETAVNEGIGNIWGWVENTQKIS